MFFIEKRLFPFFSFLLRNTCSVFFKLYCYEAFIELVTLADDQLINCFD